MRRLSLKSTLFGVDPFYAASFIEIHSLWGWPGKWNWYNEWLTVIETLKITDWGSWFYAASFIEIHSLWGWPNFCDGNSFFVFFRFLHKNSGTLWNEKGNNKSNLREILVSDSKSNIFSQSLYFRDFKSRNPFEFAAFKMVEMAGVEPASWELSVIPSTRLVTGWSFGTVRSGLPPFRQLAVSGGNRPVCTTITPVPDVDAGLPISGVWEPTRRLIKQR